MVRELAPAGWRSHPKQADVFLQAKPIRPIYDGYAAEREQAPRHRGSGVKSDHFQANLVLGQ